MSVIFGTYQSAQRISEGIQKADASDGPKCWSVTKRIAQRECAARNAAPQLTNVFANSLYATTVRRFLRPTASTKPPHQGSTRAAHCLKMSGAPIRTISWLGRWTTRRRFGVELYRRSYADAVRNGWLSDYRIIAMAVGGHEATDVANMLVREADEQASIDAEAASKTTTGSGRKRRAPIRRADRLPSTGDYLKGMGFALAMGGAARTSSGSRLPLRSCIGFLNTINRSKAMTAVLQSEAVREWVAKQSGEPVAEYRLEHLDSSSSVAQRDEARRRLATANGITPHGVLNVGIFGEGTDSAVAFSGRVLGAP